MLQLAQALFLISDGCFIEGKKNFIVDRFLWVNQHLGKLEIQKLHVPSISSAHCRTITSQKLKIICGKLFRAFARYYSHENLNYHVQWYACLVCTLTRYPGDCHSANKPQRPLWCHQESLLCWKPRWDLCFYVDVWPPPDQYLSYEPSKIHGSRIDVRFFWLLCWVQNTV